MLGQAPRSQLSKKIKDTSVDRGRVYMSPQRLPLGAGPSPTEDLHLRASKGGHRNGWRSSKAATRISVGRLGASRAKDRDQGGVHGKSRVPTSEDPTPTLDSRTKAWTLFSQAPGRPSLWPAQVMRSHEEPEDEGTGVMKPRPLGSNLPSVV